VTTRQKGARASWSPVSTSATTIATRAATGGGDPPRGCDSTLARMRHCGKALDGPAGSSRRPRRVTPPADLSIIPAPSFRSLAMQALAALPPATAPRRENCVTAHGPAAAAHPGARRRPPGGSRGTPARHGPPELPPRAVHERRSARSANARAQGACRQP
jgi:hypothetical protein